MVWWRRKGPPCVGVACFPVSASASEAFAHLVTHGIEVQPARASGHEQRLRLTHRDWGRAELTFPVEVPASQLLEWERRLTDDERANARRAGWAASIVLESPAGDLLRDRKHLLRFLHAALGAGGAVAFDAISATFWPPAALRDELCHDAELDIEALFTLHLVSESADSAYWLHSHGLKEIGFTDFDILDPSPDLGARAGDLFRALALAIVEGRLGPEGPPLEVARGLRVRLVPVSQFLARADPTAFPLWRRDVDEGHTVGHAVVCEPAPGLLGRWRERPRPAAFFSGPMPEDLLVEFSADATALMAGRARGTYPLLRRVAEELEEFAFPILAKIAYPVRDSADNEHLWFEVHSLAGDHLDATLVNEPFAIPEMKVGDRGRHDAERLSDWAILTPLGPINPRWTVALRKIRENPDEVRRLIQRERTATPGES